MQSGLKTATQAVEDVEALSIPLTSKGVYYVNKLTEGLVNRCVQIILQKNKYFFQFP